ncbi:MAG TPA: tetratricopeptide repeat protein [Ktedonosporobacter sp.]|jgi:tetratricopeptide (TPR) repeat protein|nr:tetratricopeptide repeat protein [Ktedonosporobacter sp.]
MIEHDFIGREKELEIFTRWLTDPHAPWIVYFYDQLEEADKKGGVGKTWLLHKCKEIVRQRQRDIAVVAIDFFNIEHRDAITIAREIVNALQAVFPSWSPAIFNEALDDYHHSIETGTLDIEDVRSKLSTALLADLHTLDGQLQQGKKHLVVFFDTFELVEQNPLIAVLNPSHTFPDNYQFAHIGAVIAGRNALDWQHPNWKGREQEILPVAVAPFSLQEMVLYINKQTGLDPQQIGEYAPALYQRTEGRPILVGLMADLLNHHIMSLNDLVALPVNSFEAHLVRQVNNLDNPINWVILFMAHIYHRFNISLLDWILARSTLIDAVPGAGQQKLIRTLPTLSFVRRAGTGEDFVLHDEMRRLVRVHWWDVNDTEQEFRRELSRCAISYYENELEHIQSTPLRQAYSVELLYHRLYVDREAGFHYFEHSFNRAIRLWQTSFANSLLQEAKKFSTSMSAEQNYSLTTAEARLLRLEEEPGAAIALYEKLEREADRSWFDQHFGTILYEKGRCYLLQSNLPQAMECFSAGLEIDQQQGHTNRIAATLSQLGYIYRRQGQLDIALRYMEDSLEMYSQMGNQRDYATVLNNLGNIFRLQGKIDEAIRACKISWRIRHELFQKGDGSETAVGTSLSTMGIIYLNTGDLVRAQNLFNEAFEIFSRNRYKKGVASTYNRFGQIQLADGKLVEAQQWFAKAYQASLGVDIESQINSLNKQGWVLVLQNQYDKAIPYFTQAIELAQQVNDYYQEAESLVDLADTLERFGKHEDSQRILQTAQKIATQYRYYYLLGISEEFQGDHHYRAGNHQMAFEHYARYVHYMALYNKVQYGKAFRKIIDLLLDTPRHEISDLTNSLIAYWSAEKMEQTHPELISECQAISKSGLTR